MTHWKFVPFPDIAEMGAHDPPGLLHCVECASPRAQVYCHFQWILFGPTVSAAKLFPEQLDQRSRVVLGIR